MLIATDPRAQASVDLLLTAPTTHRLRTHPSRHATFFIASNSVAWSGKAFSTMLTARW